MALPAIAAVLRASRWPNISSGVASAFELKTAIVAAAGGNVALLDAELIAYTDAEGRTPFSAGNAVTEAALANIVEEVPQHGDIFVLIVNRYLYDVAI